MRTAMMTITRAEYRVFEIGDVLVTSFDLCLVFAYGIFLAH